MNVTEEIQEILKQISDFETKGYTEGWPARLNAIYTHIKELDEKSSPGLKVGRNVRFQVGDGHAEYIVIKVLQRIVHVVHLPVGDAYEFQGVYQRGKNLCLPIEVAIQSIKCSELTKQLFSTTA